MTPSTPSRQIDPFVQEPDGRYRIVTPTGMRLMEFLADFDLTKDSPEPWKSRPRIAAAPFIAAIEAEACRLTRENVVAARNVFMRAGYARDAHFAAIAVVELLLTALTGERYDVDDDRLTPSQLARRDALVASVEP